MSKVKKEIQTDNKPEQEVEPVALTNQDAAVLAKSFSTIVEHVARIATVYHHLAGSAAHKELSSPISAAASHATETLELIEAAIEAAPKKRKRERDPDAPKRPSSSFLMFASDRRDKLKEAHTELTNTELMRELGKQWRDAPNSVREPYLRKYAKEIELFKKQLAAYTDNKASNDSPPTKTAKTASTTKKTAATPSTSSKKSPSKGTSTSTSEGSRSGSGGASRSTASKSSSGTKSTKATKPSKDAKKASSTDKKTQSTKKTPAKKAASTTSKSDKKSKKGKSSKT